MTPRTNSLTWGGEYKDPVLEGEYRSECLPEYLRHVRLTFQWAAILNILFLISDWRYFGQPHFAVAVAGRAAIVLASLVCLVLALRARDFRVLLRICASWSVPVIAASAILVSPRNDVALLVVFILPPIFYLLIPMSFGWALGTGIACSVATLASFLSADKGSGTVPGMILAMLTINVVLALILIRWNRLKRLEWSAIRAEQAANRELLRDIAKRKQLEAHLRQLASCDPLTGLANRMRFFEQAAGEVARSKRYGRPLAVVMLDIDHFKSINDTFGHVAGDAALKAFGIACRGVLREMDTMARMGGEEFALLLPETCPDGALALARRLQDAVAAARVENLPVAMTVSAGISEVRPGEADVDAALSRADQALYEAKRAGRNRVVVHGQDAGKGGAA